MVSGTVAESVASEPGDLLPKWLFTCWNERHPRFRNASENYPTRYPRIELRARFQEAAEKAAFHASSCVAACED